MPQPRLPAVAPLAAAAAGCGLLALAVLGPGSAEGAPPPNDNFGNAQVVDPAVPAAQVRQEGEETGEARGPVRWRGLGAQREMT
jgi:hypothetical protein